MRIFLLTALFLTQAVLAAPKRPVGTVVAIAGTAARTAAGARASAPLAVRDVLREGDRVVVPSGASLLLQPTGSTECYSLKGPQQIVMAPPGRAIDRRWSRVTRRIKKSDLIEGEVQINTGVKEAEDLIPHP